MAPRKSKRSARKRRSTVLLIAVSATILFLALFQLYTAVRFSIQHLGGPPELAVATTEAKPKPKPPTRDDNNSTFSACLLVADDNHILIEWLAYHYQTLPLRYLVIAVDPRSRTSPKIVLDRWDKYMTIVRWSDRRFMPKNWINRIPHEDDPTGKLMKHRERQRNFYPACFEFLKQAGRRWTSVVDIDEFLVQNQHYRLPHQQYPTLLDAIQDQPPYNYNNTTCITMPRVRFGSFENASTALSTHQTPPGYSRRDFVTLRWIWRADLDSRKENRLPKSILQLQRIANFSRLETDAHRPVRSECPKRNMYIANRDSPFTVHHYVGSPEQFRFRKDARDGTKTRSEERLQGFAEINAANDETACTWLQGFLDNVGTSEAVRLLEGVGNVSYTDLVLGT